MSRTTTSPVLILPDAMAGIGNLFKAIHTG